MSVFSTAPTERRGEDRHPYRTQVLLQLPDGQQVVGQSLDIGKGGMGIVTDLNPPTGFVLRVRLMVPAPGSRGSVMFNARTTVANSVLAGREGGFRVGLQFDPLDDASKAALNGILPK
jgi:hypothetical protein